MPGHGPRVVHLIVSHETAISLTPLDPPPCLAQSFVSHISRNHRKLSTIPSARSQPLDPGSEASRRKAWITSSNICGSETQERLLAGAFLAV